MSLTQTIEQLVAEQKAAARAKYYELLRTGAPDPAELLAVMQRAGITTEQLRKDSQLLERVAWLAKRVELLPAARKKVEQARQVHDNARQRLDKAIADLSAPVNLAATELQAADQERQVLEQAMCELNNIYVFNTNPELMPPETAPALVRQNMAIAAEQAKINAGRAVLRNAEARLSDAQRALGQRQAELKAAQERASFPGGQTKGEKERSERPYHDAIASAQAVVDAANTELQAVQKESEY